MHYVGTSDKDRALGRKQASKRGRNSCRISFH